MARRAKSPMINDDGSDNEQEYPTPTPIKKPVEKPTRRPREEKEGEEGGGDGGAVTGAEVRPKKRTRMSARKKLEAGDAEGKKGRKKKAVAPMDKPKKKKNEPLLDEDDRTMADRELFEERRVDNKFCSWCGTSLRTQGYMSAVNNHGPGTTCNMTDWNKLAVQAHENAKERKKQLAEERKQRNKESKVSNKAAKKGKRE